MTSILIVDDHRIFAEGLKALLQRESELNVIAIADNGAEALQMAEKHQPQLVITDLNMPQQSGFDVVKLLKLKYPKIKILVLTMHNDKRFAEEIKLLGADGFVLKNAEAKQLLHAVKTVIFGGSFFSKMNTDSVEMPITTDRDGLKMRMLTVREKEILQLLTQDLTAAQIADKLFLSTYTVETHKRNLLKKLDMKSSSGLVNFAIKNGL